MRSYILLALAGLSYVASGCQKVSVVEEDDWGSYTSESPVGACTTVYSEDLGDLYLSFEYTCDGGDPQQKTYIGAKDCSGSSVLTSDPCDSSSNSTCTATCTGSGSCNLGYITRYADADETCSDDFLIKAAGLLDECDSGTIATCGDTEITIKIYAEDDCTGDSEELKYNKACECDFDNDFGCRIFECGACALKLSIAIIAVFIAGLFV